MYGSGSLSRESSSGDDATMAAGWGLICLCLDVIVDSVARYRY